MKKRGNIDAAEKSKFFASLGKRWKMLPPEIKAKYEKMAEEENGKQRPFSRNNARRKLENWVYPPMRLGT